MSKQSKKQKKRRDRQKKRRRRILTTLFKTLYPKAPPDLASLIIDQFLATTLIIPQPARSNTEIIKQATLVYVRQHLTNYQQHLNDYTETVLQHIALGQPYREQTPQSIAQEADRQAELIIKLWQAKP